jgi:hypothetical protein
MALKTAIIWKYLNFIKVYLLAHSIDL